MRRLANLFERRIGQGQRPDLRQRLRRCPRPGTAASGCLRCPKSRPWCRTGRRSHHRRSPVRPLAS
jgi:hypothetical protein